ncbi:hypothetical protein [Cryptosporangium arvum]|nr:hypothetical protein [Cryptosporangium arvum]
MTRRRSARRFPGGHRGPPVAYLTDRRLTPGARLVRESGGPPAAVAG